MKLYKSLSLLAVGLGAVGVVAAQGCSSSTAAPTTTAASGTTPPGPPSAGATTDTTTRVFALNQLFLGEVGRSGPVKDAWKDFGYNIDGLATTKTDTNVCTRIGGADPAKQEDGNGGIDNSFGHTIVGFIQGIAPNPSKTINDSIQSGSFTILLEVTGLSDDPKQSATGLSGRLLVGGTYSPDDKTKKPTFATNDDWPFRASPIVNISNAYVNNGTFVNGASGADVELSLFIQGVQLSLTIKRAAITFDHTGAHDAANGTISGVINTEQLVTGIKSVAGRISTQLCGGSTLDTIEQTIRQASDIHSDGTNGPGAPCDAISIGIGFTAKQIGPAKTAAKDSPAPPDPCADAGAGGDAGDGG